jgi:hypothetical protein
MIFRPWPAAPRSPSRRKRPKLANDRRGDIEDMLRGLRVMTAIEQGKVGSLAQSGRALEDRRHAAPGPCPMHQRVVKSASDRQLNQG